MKFGCEEPAEFFRGENALSTEKKDKSPAKPRKKNRIAVLSGVLPLWIFG
jgi:hypothetical protein